MRWRAAVVADEDARRLVAREEGLDGTREEGANAGTVAAAGGSVRVIERDAMTMARK